MRTGYRKAVKRIEKSGNHAEHKGSFCDQKYYVMLMLDWYDVRGGDSANDYCKRYFDVHLDEDNGGAFNSTTIEQDRNPLNLAKNWTRFETEKGARGESLTRECKPPTYRGSVREDGKSLRRDRV